jgi:hypothetical protein
MSYVLKSIEVMLSIDIKVFCDLFCKGGGRGGGQLKGLGVYSRGDLQA